MNSQEIKATDLRPDALNFINSFRSIGYSLDTAVADVMDNSIAAGADEIRVNMPHRKWHRLSILDNGVGMSRKVLLEAMRFGGRTGVKGNPETELGRFGLGLKSASLSQCRCLTVITKQARRPLFVARWDLDYIQETGEWLLLEPDISQIEQIPELEWLRSQKSGTLVVWEKFDLMMQDFQDNFESPALERMLMDVKAHLELVFHRFLEDGDLKISINGTALSPRDPFLRKVHGKRVQPPAPPSTYKLLGKTITVQPWLLPHPSKLSAADVERAGDLQRYQGFYIYRCKRLIIWGSWFQLQPKSELSRLARIQVDIPSDRDLDQLWNLDVKKSKAILPLQLRETLKKQIENLRLKSDRAFNKRTKRELTVGGLWVREVNEFDNPTYTLNMETGLLAAIVEKYPEMKAVFRMIAEVVPVNAIYEDLANYKKIAVKTVKNSNDLETLRELGMTDEQLELYRRMIDEF